MALDAGRRVETDLCKPDLCMLAAGRVSTNDLQMKQGVKARSGDTFRLMKDLKCDLQAFSLFS